jgi:hypothetical protein
LIPPPSTSTTDRLWAEPVQTGGVPRVPAHRAMRLCVIAMHDGAPSGPLSPIQGFILPVLDSVRRKLEPGLGQRGLASPGSPHRGVRVDPRGSRLRSEALILALHKLHIAHGSLSTASPPHKPNFERNTTEYSRSRGLHELGIVHIARINAELKKKTVFQLLCPGSFHKLSSHRQTVTEMGA